MTVTHEEWDDSLLVAYVDGELDIDGREKVQRILATDPQAMQIVERLQASADACRGAFSSTLQEPLPEPLLQAVRSKGAGRLGPRPVSRSTLSWTFSGWWRIGAVPLSAACGALIALAILRVVPTNGDIRLAAGPDGPLPPEALSTLADVLEQGGSRAEGALADGRTWQLQVQPPDQGIGGCRPLLYSAGTLPGIAGIACPSGDGLWSIATTELDRTDP